MNTSPTLPVNPTQSCREVNRVTHFQVCGSVGLVCFPVFLFEVALFHNLRLMTRMNKVQYQEPAISWTEDEQHSGITKYGIQHY